MANKIIELISDFFNIDEEKGENNEITELENMEISFKIIDESTWDILYTTEPFIIEF